MGSSGNAEYMGSNNDNNYNKKKMKLSIALLSACVTAEKTWFTKEWQVIEAYDNDQEIRLVDPNIRSNKQWHDCGAKPATPVNGRDVVCNGATCAAVCPLGWRSQGRWKIKCQADNTWSHSKFSPCVTCPDISTELDSLNDGVQVVEAFVKNLPVVRFFCGDSTDTMNFMGKAYKKGGNYKNAKCLCKNGQNGDPSWKNLAHGHSRVIHLLVVMLLMPLVIQNNQITINQMVMIHWIKIMLIWMLKINKIQIIKTTNNHMTV